MSLVLVKFGEIYVNPEEVVTVRRCDFDQEKTMIITSSPEMESMRIIVNLPIDKAVGRLTGSMR